MNNKYFSFKNLTFPLGCGLFVISLLLLLYTFYSGHSCGFRPVKSEANAASYVGQLRCSYHIKTRMEYLGADIAKLEFSEIVRGGAITEGYDVIKIKRTLKTTVSGRANFVVLRFCPEDGFWYIIYYPNYMEGKNPPVGPGTDIINYSVPPDVIKEPGIYALGVEEIGYCKFEVK